MMQKQIDSFSGKCKKMPKQLREWDAYHELKKEIEDFQTVLPLLTDLAKPSITELKGSIGETPNHSNFSGRSSVKILSKFRIKFRIKFRNFR